MNRSKVGLHGFVIGVVLLATVATVIGRGRLLAQVGNASRHANTSSTAASQDANLNPHRLISTTLRTNAGTTTVSCTSSLCENLGLVFEPSVAFIKCPHAAGGTCTYYLHLETQVSVSSLDTGVFEFLVDGVAPSPGPTDAMGFFAWDASDPNSSILQARSFAVVAQVTNSASNQTHSIEVQFGCIDTTGDGCSATKGLTSMSIGLYTP